MDEGVGLLAVVDLGLVVFAEGDDLDAEGLEVVGDDLAVLDDDGAGRDWWGCWRESRNY